MGLLDIARSLFAPANSQAIAAPAPTTRADSWSNLVTGIGAATGRLDFQFQREWRIDDQTLEDMFHGDPYASRIVRAVPEEALRRGFSVACGDPAVESEIKRALDDLHVLRKVTEAWTWARLFGGAALFIGADDKRDPKEPLDTANIRAIRFVTVLDKREMYPAKWFSDPLSPYFGEPETYRFVRSGAGGTDSREVHATRIVRFDGAVTSRRRRQQNNSWCESELQRIISKLREFNGNSAAASTLLQDASQGVFKIKDLMTLIAQDKQDVVRKRLQLMDMARGVARAIMLDADGEDFERVESGIATGMADLVDKSFLLLAGAAEIPVTILFGQAPAGLSATGDSDIRWFYDRLDSARTNNVQPRLERIVRMFLRAQNGPTGGVEPEAWTIKWPSLYQLTDAEQADLRAKQATIDTQYITAQVLTPEEVRANRFRRDGYSTETSLDDGDEGASADLGELGAEAIGAVPEEALDVVKRVAAREIPRDSGLQAILAAMPGLALEQAEKIMGEAGKTFFTTPDPMAQPELEQLRAENAALKRSVQGLKNWNSRIVQRAKDGGLELGGLVDRAPTEVAEGDELQEGDVVAVPVDPADVLPSATAEPEKADGRADAQPEVVPAPRGVAVVLPLPQAGRDALASVSQLPLDQLHVTLAYFEQLSDEQLVKLREVVTAWSQYARPIAATLKGHGRFVGESGADPVYVSIEATELVQLRGYLVMLLRSFGLEPSSKHDFVPHVTIAYVPPGVELEEIGAPTAVTFGAVAVWAGDDHGDEIALGR